MRLLFTPSATGPDALWHRHHSQPPTRHLLQAGLFSRRDSERIVAATRGASTLVHWRNIPASLQETVVPIGPLIEHIQANGNGIDTPAAEDATSHARSLHGEPLDAGQCRLIHEAISRHLEHNPLIPTAKRIRLALLLDLFQPRQLEHELPTD